jgi:hypothetical protein
MNDNDYIKLHKKFTLRKLQGVVTGLTGYLKKYRVKIKSGTVKNKFTKLKRSGAIDQEKVEEEAFKEIEKKMDKKITKKSLPTRDLPTKEKVINMTISKNKKNTPKITNKPNGSIKTEGEDMVIKMTPYQKKNWSTYSKSNSRNRNYH